MLTMATHPRRTAQLLSAFRSLALMAQSESGFISSRLLLDTEEPNTLCYVEEWKSVEDLDEQIRSTRYTQLLALMEAATEPPDLRLNWVTEVKGLQYLETVRLPAAERGE